MRTPLLSVVLALLLIPAALHAQAVPTAKRLADLQVGVTFSLANPDYANDIYHLQQPTSGQLRWHGYGAYSDLDIRYHFGLEAAFHTVSGPDPTLYERSYEIGPRFVFPVGFRLAPYAKAMIGRGIFNFAALNSAGQSVQLANLGYTTETLGGGLDLRLRPGLNIRVFDYEYQRWNNFPPNKLSPQVLSFGIAYHFHGPIGRGPR